MWGEEWFEFHECLSYAPDINQNNESLTCSSFIDTLAALVRTSFERYLILGSTLQEQFHRPGEGNTKPEPGMRDLTYIETGETWPVLQ